MAITTTTISKAVGWARTDLIYQIEEAFAWLGWQGGTVSGIVTGISAYSGGGNTGTTDYYYDVPVATTTGIGTGASFYVYRNSTISQIWVNRPGVGYTNGEYVTLSAADIGGGSAVAIGLTVFVAGGSSPVGYGSTSTFFDKGVTVSSSYPWGVARHQIQANKRFGDTYRGIQATSATVLAITHGSSFHPWDTDNASNRGNGYGNRFAGNSGAELPTSYQSTDMHISYDSSSISNSRYPYGYLGGRAITVASSSSYKLDLNIYRSAIDPNFAVFAYKHPTLSSTSISNNNFAVFFFHNFTTPIWDLDYLYLGGVTYIDPTSSSTIVPSIDFTTYLANSTINKRSAEWGYSSSGAQYIKTSTYESNLYPGSGGPYPGSTSFYTRDTTYSKFGYGTSGNTSGAETLNSNVFYNAVIKGIPLCTNIAPTPYYLPDDFVLIDFRINAPSVNVQQGDTITISGSEVYKVITASYNQTTTTRGIAFCGRSV